MFQLSNYAAFLERHPKSLPILGLLVNAVVWGSSWIAFKSLGAAGLHPLWVTAAIYAVAVVVAHAISPRATRDALRSPSLRGVLLAAGATNVCFNTAVALGDVIRVTLLFYLMPVWAALLARLVLHEAFSTTQVLRLGVGLVGAGLVLYQPNMGLPLPRSLSDWLGLAGGFFFAANNIMLRRSATDPLASDSGRAQAMFLGGCGCSAALGLGLAATGLIAWPTAVLAAPEPWAVWGTLALWAVLFLFANYGVQYGAARLSAQLTALVMLSEVAVAAFSAVALGAAVLRWQDVAGGALILIAPFLSARLFAPSKPVSVTKP